MDTKFWKLLKLATRSAAKNFARRRDFGAAFVSAGRAAPHEFRSFEPIWPRNPEICTPPPARAHVGVGA